jgi:hypothetical protein
MIGIIVGIALLGGCELIKAQMLTGPNLENEELQNENQRV